MTHETDQTHYPQQHQGSCCSHEQSASHNLEAEKKYTDPVCGMQVGKNPEKTARFQGVAYYFCSSSCVTKFNASPETYVKAKKVVGLGNMVAAAPIAEKVAAEPAS